MVLCGQLWGGRCMCHSSAGNTIRRYPRRVASAAQGFPKQRVAWTSSVSTRLASNGGGLFAACTEIRRLGVLFVTKSSVLRDVVSSCVDAPPQNTTARLARLKCSAMWSHESRLHEKGKARETAKQNSAGTTSMRRFLKRRYICFNHMFPSLKLIARLEISKRLLISKPRAICATALSSCTHPSPSRTSSCTSPRLASLGG
jgi:hypothetical protein